MLRFAGLLAAALLGGLNAHAQPAGGADLALTVTLCTACHRDKFDAAERNPHAQLDNPDWQQRTGLGLSCLSCHGDVSTHMRTGGGRGNNVFAFREETPLAQNATCLGCHRDTHPNFDRSPHAAAGLACTSCHSQHHAAAEPLLRAADAAQTQRDLSPVGGICFDCHAETFTDFAFNEHHRLREGVLECTSCHDPHEPVSRSLLGGFNQQQCATCHADKGGPFVFEHAASRTEGCTACHSPHGSPNRHMLTHQRVAEQCLTCHAVLPQFHFGFNPAAPPRFGLETQCTNCHSAIHGSNFDPFFLK